MKENLFVEFRGDKMEQKQLVKLAKDIWTDQGNKIKDLKTLDLYYKPEESTCYYVINGDVTGSFNI